MKSCLNHCHDLIESYSPFHPELLQLQSPKFQLSKYLTFSSLDEDNAWVGRGQNMEAEIAFLFLLVLYQWISSNMTTNIPFTHFFKKKQGGCIFEI